ncbi:hypothetical protein C9994_00220 [Marivirga lumbricoides]|uniref:Uncharacterized protein n=1 Tax=Marivirga lumbricoides TaxID=1046115 RepID=A0A2T4DW31_9BACT|nr:hypothetical protein C9994_00220 [Marivirga lumbricoides]
MKDLNYLSPSELIEKYPEVATKFNWSARELGLFLKCKLLDGYYDRRKRSALIKEHSFLELVHFVNSVIDSQKINF